MRNKIVVCFCAVVILSACGGLPKGISPVQSFTTERYLGTWYEIARLDHRFERGLSNVSAQYSMRDDGQLRVVNRGFDEEEQQFSEAIGRAKFAGEDDEGYLKVSFFGPFFGSYVVFELDDDYQRAFVAGSDRSYLWFLSRTPSVSKEHMDEFIKRGTALGFPMEELIVVDQSKNHK